MAHDSPAPGKSCTNCTNCLLIDEGWSNYTVENTAVHCVLNQHPLTPYDNWYGHDWRSGFADYCAHFTEGEPMTLDVDHKGLHLLTPVALRFLEQDAA